jgi:hypothetical protein
MTPTIPRESRGAPLERARGEPVRLQIDRSPLGRRAVPPHARRESCRKVRPCPSRARATAPERRCLADGVHACSDVASNGRIVRETRRIIDGVRAEESIAGIVRARRGHYAPEFHAEVRGGAENGNALPGQQPDAEGAARHREGAERGAAISPPDPQNLALWMERSGARALGARPGEQFLRALAVLRVLRVNRLLLRDQRDRGAEILNGSNSAARNRSRSLTPCTPSVRHVARGRPTPHSPLARS